MEERVEKRLDFHYVTTAQNLRTTCTLVHHLMISVPPSAIDISRQTHPIGKQSNVRAFVFDRFVVDLIVRMSLSNK